MQNMKITPLKHQFLCFFTTLDLIWPKFCPKDHTHFTIINTFDKMNPNKKILKVFLKKFLMFIIFVLILVFQTKIKIYIIKVCHNQYIKNFQSRYLFSTYQTYCRHAIKMTSLCTTSTFFQNRALVKLFSKHSQHI